MLSRTSTQIVQALIELAKLADGECEGAASIAERIKAPQNYLGKLLQQLANEGIVISRKGSGGGFRLGRDPKTITLYDVVGSVENVDSWTSCALGVKKCSDVSPCPVHDRWKAVRDTYFDFLQKTTIADLV